MYQTQKQKGEGWKRNWMLNWRKGWKHQHANEYKRRANKTTLWQPRENILNWWQSFNGLKKHQNGDNVSMDFKNIKMATTFQWMWWCQG